MTEMTINGKDIRTYHARLQTYSVSGTVFNYSASASGELLRLPRVYHTVLAPRSLSVTLTFFPHNHGDDSRGTSIPERLSRTASNITKFESDIICRTVEIGLPDGYYYTAFLTASQPAAVDATGEQDVVYTFTAVRHGLPVKKTVSSGGKLFCLSNTRTPLRIALTLSVAQNSITLCGIVINNVAANSELVIDSVNGLITQGGINKFNDTEFSDFPYLTPGENTIGCSAATDAITVLYTPIYA